MNAKESLMRSRGRSPFVVGLALVLCSTAFGAQSLFAAAPAPQVRFDQTVVPPDVPPQVLIGENATFRVRFKNNQSSGATMGYGPFIDVVLDAGGANMTKPPHDPSCPCDGMTFLQANMIQVNGGTVSLVSHTTQAPCVPSASKVPLNHPFAGSGVSPVMVPAGSQLATIELPFGSFDPTQPEVVVEVTFHVSNLEDANAPPLKIYARGGFRFGATPANDAPPDWPIVSDVVPGSPPLDQNTDSTSWASQQPTTPTVIIIRKKYLGAEDETATGPNFVRRYEVTADIANGQTVNNLTLTDHLPNNMAYHAMVSLTPPCVLAPFTGIPNQANAGSANSLVWNCSSVTGVTTPDVTAVFEVFIPQFDATGSPILGLSNCDAAAVNDIAAECDWTPIDACDAGPVHVVSDLTPADHTLTGKCLAIQKTMVDLSAGTGAHPIPGDTLQYTLSFQLSDFKTTGSLRVQDFLSDGQTVVPPLTLTVTDQCGTTSGPISASNWSQSSISCGSGEPPLRTLVDIRVGDAMAALATPGGPSRHQNGILTGGYATATPSNVPATGTITFNAVINDAYQCPVASPHDLFVDKDDPLTNSVTLTGQIFSNASTCSSIPTPTGPVAQDSSAIKFRIASDVLQKSVYAVKRGSTEICGPNTSPCPPKPDVFPGDQVTFRLKKTIPSGDAENLTVQDWLPLPAFPVSGGSFTNSPCGLPAAGNSCLGPANTLSVAPPPAFSSDAATNSIKFAYGSFNDPANHAQTIDLLFTGVVVNTPFNDLLYVANEAGECESDTFGVIFCQAAIAQVAVRQPVLRITKGVVAANNPNATFSPTQIGPVTFTQPGTVCGRFSGTINAANLASTPITSDVSNIDQNDCVTFAIVVENTGGAPAYDIKLADLFPLDSSSNLECFDPNFATLCVTDGTGAPIPFTTGSGFLNGNDPITLQTPLPGMSSTGSNIAVITFDACVIKQIKPHCCNNTARLDNYASTPGGPNFVAAGLGGPLQDTAQLCILPQATKLITTTSEAHTLGTPSGSPLSPEQLAIGEIIRYRLQVVVPESVLTGSFQLQDSLPAGLSYLPGTASVITMSSGLTASNALPLVSGGTTCSSGGGGPLLFDFGTVTNSSNNAAQELIVLEFNALVCNVASNQSGVNRNNSFGVLVGGQQIATSNTVTALVVEPNITITKVASVSSLSVGASVTYTITLSNNGTATAFDSRLTDALPPCLTTLGAIQISTSGAVTGIVNSTFGNGLLLTIGVIPVNATVIVQYSATMTCVDCSQLINGAKVTWTSLPGPLGTAVNPTNSTAGAGGSPDGERQFGGGVNDYAAVASASLCCIGVSNPTASCTNGISTYTFTATNFTNSAVSGVTVTPISPANTTITPGTTTISLPSGASTTLTLTFAGPGIVAGAQSCFSVALIGQAGAVCQIERCITLPSCCVAPPAQMVAWYPLDELGVRFTNDVAPSPGSTFNNVGNAVSGVSSVAGRVNIAKYFTGGSGYYSVATQSDLEFGGNSFSVDAWVRAVGCGPGQLSPIVDKLDTNAGTGFAFYLDQPVTGNAVLKLQVNASTFTSGGTITTGAHPLQDTGPWFLIAATVDAAGVGTFYIDGVPAGTFAASTGPLTNTVPMWIGQTRVGNNRCEIAIDELELFKRALTQSEIKGIFDAGSSGKCRSEGTICVTKFEDLNGNGTQETGELQLGGWTFNVTDPNNAQVGAITTNPPGMPAACLAVTPGSFTITEVLQSGWTATTPNPQTVTALAGQTQNLSFGNKQSAAKICVTKFEDVNGNGLQDTGELQLAGWTFNVTDPNNAQVGAITTNPPGMPAACLAVTPGSYTVTEVVQSGWTATTPNPRTVTALAGQTQNLSFGNKRSAAKICVTKFEDVNGNGLQDTGELQLGGWTFNVTDPNNVQVGAITTNPPGMPAACLAVTPGSFTITEVLQSGWTATTPNPQTVTASAGQTQNLSFGNRQVPQACMSLSNAATTCNKDGSFTHTFTVTNSSSTTVTAVNLSSVSPTNATIAPASSTTFLSPGASTTVTVIISGPGAVSGTNVCFTVALVGSGGVGVCKIQQCVTLPKCCIDPPAGMVAWYPLDAVAPVDDIAPAPGSIVNNVGTAKPGLLGGLPTPVAGKVNGALYFDGPYVEVPAQAELDLSGEGFSIDAWIKVDRCQNAIYPIVDKWDGARGYVFYIEQSAGGGAVLKLRINGSVFTGGSISLGTGQWVHVAVTVRVQSVSEFLINGAPAGTFTTSTPAGVTDLPMWIGRSRVEGRSCAIAIDELELFNRGLREDEIQGIFNAGTWGKCHVGGTICVTKFEDLNRSGRQDPGEPLLAGWTFNVTHGSLNNIQDGQITTNPPAAACMALTPGTYTIAEIVQAGWTPTTAIEQTVTVSAGQTVNVTFGNWIRHRRRPTR
jgi:uncharacterized repeat protein (TIGR01451 family)